MILKQNKIKLMDTTLRDGEQTQGVSFTLPEKANIAKTLLKKLRVDRLEVTSARISEGELGSVQNITSWANDNGFLDSIEVLGFIDKQKSVDWIKESGCKTMNLLTKGSENHCKNQLKKDLNQHVKDIRQTLKYAFKNNLNVNIYLEDWSNGYFNSPKYVFDMMDSLKNEGINHFMLPDTLGVLSPDEVFLSLSDMIEKHPWATFDFHPHNDYGLGVANVLYAVKAGVRNIHCTMNCLGERAGNASLAEIVVTLKDKLDMELSIDESNLAPVSEMIESFSGKRLPDNAPIVGENVFTQTSGIHADGDKKGNLYHNPIVPERFGRKRSYALGKMSGKASLTKNLEILGIQLIEENLQKVLKRVVELGDTKKTMTAADLPMIITDVLETSESQRIELLNCSISSGLSLRATATIHLRIDSKEYLEVGSGNGGYDAFMSAVKKVLKNINLNPPELVDYQIRIPRGGKTNALTEAIITWEVDGKRLQTIGIDSDQVIAAVNSTLKMLNLQLIQSKTSKKIV